MIAAPLSGCVGLEGLVAPASGPLEPAALPASVDPEAPTSPLTVPAVHLGDTASFETHTEGFRFEPQDDRHEEWTVVPYESNDASRRAVAAATVHDAWLQPVAGVEYRYSFEDLDHDEHELRGYRSSTVFETATGLSVVFEFAYDQVTYSRACSNGSCHESESSKPVVSRAYPRERTEASWGDLAGKQLQVGDKILFERTSNLGGAEYRMTLEYNVLREESVDGERALVVSAATRSERVGDDTTTLDHGHPIHRTEASVEVPEPVTLLWYTESASVPVRQYHEYSFADGGKVYTTKSTTQLVRYEAGEHPIEWGSGEPVAPVAGVSSERGIIARDYVPRTTWGGYPMNEAWTRINQDILLGEYRDWKARNPDGRITAATFLPEPEERQRTWLFDVGGIQDDRLTVASRISHPTPLPVATYENRDDAMRADFWRASEPVDAQTMLLDLSEAAAIFKVVADGRLNEPGVVVRFTPNAFFWEDSQATAVFGEMAPMLSSQAATADLYFGMMEQPVTIDLTDGGLRGVNNDFAWIMVYWSSLPTFAGLGLEATASGGLPGSLPALGARLPLIEEA